MRVEYHPEAANDLNRAIKFYEQRHQGLGAACRDEIYKAMDQIAVAPTHYRKIQDEIRRHFLKRFPFSILFRVVGDDVVRVLAIRHHRQHPEFGLSRR